ncbi:MAG TPA: amidohydrolase [Phototrophicaceae bacterium]|jgi:amidohydrolase|nr:amidohydrolase [Phototrophicaceae bacterium]
MSQYVDQARALQEQLVAWRREIHMHPELGFEEKRTSGFVADNLRQMGLEIQTGVGITGIVARIGDGNGPVIGIRADMDALPIQEANNVPYASKTPGLMHACGHDAHTAILMGVAKLLNETQDLPSGEIRLLFQPSEERWDSEGKSGATRMMDDRALEGLDAVIALHVDSGAPAGQVEIGGGFVAAAVDDFDGVILGEGCHGASPHKGFDPIYIQAQVVNAIQGIRSRRIDPTQPAVITIGTIHGGSATNIIPNEVRMTGTIRSFSEDIRDQLHAELDRAFGVAKALGGDYTLKIQRGYPALYNDPGVADLIRQVSTSAIGDAKTVGGVAQMGAEDFAYMAKAAPGAMFMLGARFDDLNRPHHSPIFDINEDCFQVGAAVLAESAVRLLREKSQR